MKKVIPGMIALVLLSGNALFAQSLVGTWQGSLQPPGAPREFRIVIKISTTDADTLKAALYSIDQGGQPINATSITLQGSTVKMSVVAIGGTYEGKLSSDGNSITGTWTQGPAPLPLSLARATNETAWTIPEPPPPPKIMAPDANPTFEVATIKPSKPEERFSLLVNRSGMLNTTATSVSDLLKFAYDLHPKQIKGPSWMDTDKFDVTGKPDTEGIPSISQLKVMVQKLLADRFQLTFHRDKKDLSVYAITIVKGGAKITKDDSNPNGLPGFGGGGRGNMNIRNATITEFAQMLQANGILDQPVVDQTGFGAARYDFTLKWTPDASQPGFGGATAPNAPPAPAGDNLDAPPDLFAAFQQQLGLKLESTKAPVDVLVIDRVERPSDN